ncbi:hypothetical protein [Kaistia terrae]|uniref:Uncharacterized protein n=1 Tax=Kaistia terrae TaxID=537017 RepID=A0ABW0Q2Z9_9HYPH|nr:hypothetical protein [Kaistia terrae]MCX5581453.1 hypothetical protein [Kaistia terrae]
MMPRHEIPTPDDLVAALQSAGSDLILAAGMVFNEDVNNCPPPADALHRANIAIGNARDAINAFERSRRLIAA